MVERRQPKPTVDFIDEYCQYYRNLFSDVRDLQVINCPTVSQNFRAKPRRVVVSLDRATPTVGQFIFWIFLRGFEAFKYLHMGMISEIKRKTLPAIAKVVGLDNHQPLHHFLTVSPWDIKLLRDLQVINCPTVSQNFRAKPRRVVVSLDRATPTVGQFIFWIFLRDLQVINCPTVSQNFRAKPRRVVVSLDRATPTVGQFIFWIFLRDLQVINCPTVSQNFRAKPRRVVVSLDRATPTVGQFIFWIFLTEIRLQLILDILSGRPIILMIDETGDKKKGKSTDYVKRQYIGNLGKTDNGIVAVTAYAVFCGMTFPLTFEIYKPRERLRDLQVINCPTVSQNFRAKPRRVVVSLGRATPTVGQFIFWIFLKEGDKYLTKPQIAAQMIKELGTCK